MDEVKTGMDEAKSVAIEAAATALLEASSMLEELARRIRLRPTTEWWRAKLTATEIAVEAAVEATVIFNKPADVRPTYLEEVLALARKLRLESAP